MIPFTPAFKIILDLIEKDLIKHIAEHYIISKFNIHKFIKSLKGDHIEENRDWELFDFPYGSWYSSQIDSILHYLSRINIVRFDIGGYRLTPYGYKKLKEVKESET
jgi:hypothetical protein